MKVFLKILWIIILVAAIGLPNSHAQTLYVKKDTTMTFNVSVINSIEATYIWTIKPALTGFNPGTDSVQSVKFNGNADDVFTLSVIPVGLTGCAGNPQSLDIKLYDNNLPVNVSWKEDPAPLCPEPGNVVEGTIIMSGYSGSYSIVYQFEDDAIKTADFNTDSKASVIINKGLTNTSTSKYAEYKVRILRCITNKDIFTYGKDNAPTLTIKVKPVPYIEEIEFK